MLPPNLVLSLGGLFEIQLLIYCLPPPEHRRDGHFSDALRELPWSAAFLDPDRALAALRTAAAAAADGVGGGASGLTMVACEDFYNLHDEDLDQEDFFGSRVVWLVPDSELLTSRSLPLRLDTFLISYRQESNDSLDLMETYAVKGSRRKGRLGTWNPTDEGGELNVPVVSTWERRSDLGGTKLVATVETWKPFLEVVEKADDGEENAGLEAVGLFADLVFTLQASLNFRCGYRQGGLGAEILNFLGPRPILKPQKHPATHLH